VEVNGAFSVGPPKISAGRRTVTVPAVRAAVVDALAEHLAHYTALSTDAFMFLSSQGQHLRRSSLNRRVWQPCARFACPRASR
jgi:hypothetical protein